jgi:energy-converting hydrogenase Eha subunit E
VIRVVSAELAYSLSIAVKMAVTALFFVGATITAERAGPLVGGLVSVLPVTSGPAYVFLALDHDLAFISQAALGGLVCTAPICVFAVVYAALAQRHRVATSVGIAFAIWFAIAAVLFRYNWTTVGAVVLNIVVVGACLLIGRRYQLAERPVVVRRWYDIPLRAGLVAILIAAVVTLSSHVGPMLTGVIAAFPIVLFSLMLILQPRMGGRAAAAVLANSVIGMVGFGLFCLTLHLSVESLGIAAGLCLAIAVNGAASGVSWLVHS